MERQGLRGALVLVGPLLLAVLIFFSVRCASQQSESLTDLVRAFNESQVFWQQLQIAQKLVERNDRSVLPQIEPYLKNEDRHLRGNAAFVSAGLGEERGLKVIYEILQDRSSPRPDGQGVPSAPWSVAPRIKSDRYYAVHLLGLLKNPRTVAAQQPAPRLELCMPQSTFEAGTAVKLYVIVRNFSDEANLIPKVDGHAEDYLHIEVRAPDGKQLERIDRQTLLRNGKTYSFPKRGWGSRKLETIKPKDESRNYLVLSDLFDLSEPGAYSVSAKADLQRPYSGPEIKWVETAAQKIGFVVKRE